MITSDTAKKILDEADELFSAPTVSQSVKRMADEVTASLSEQYPLILAVMGGAVVFTGQFLPLLAFPLSFDVQKFWVSKRIVPPRPVSKVRFQAGVFPQYRSWDGVYSFPART